ncbi:MAG: hypothetical protein R2684_04370 [Pyrinomonadaceae bacterium]
MLRDWVAKFNKSLNAGGASRRKELHVPIRLTFEPNRNTGSLAMNTGNLAITGETRDFSKTGLAFEVSCIRLREFYLVGEGRTLNADISLPDGNVNMKILGQRYEQVGEHLSVCRYLVGASIVSMSDHDRVVYENFLSSRKANTGPLSLGVKETS